ncbi:MAG TPA: hypothetical protein VF549_17060 [Solirubrobacteraceae bacterium]|jgi:hypothetical protein
MRRWIATGLAAAAALLVVPATSSAAESVAMSADVLTYVSGPGTVDDVTLTAGATPGTHVLAEAASPSGSVGSGCVAAAAYAAQCSGATSASLSTLDGDDTITVTDPLPSAIAAGDGDDTIDARNGVADTVDCGAGADSVRFDAIDVLTDCDLPPAAAPLPGVVEPPAFAALPVSVVVPPELAVGAAGVATFDVACAPSEARGCKGTLFLDPPRPKPRAYAAVRGRYGRSRFAVAPGEQGKVRLRLTASARRALGLPPAAKARAARRGRRVKAIVTVQPRGKKPVKQSVTLKH